MGSLLLNKLSMPIKVHDSMLLNSVLLKWGFGWSSEKNQSYSQLLNRQKRTVQHSAVTATEVATEQIKFSGIIQAFTAWVYIFLKKQSVEIAGLSSAC